ncbi:MAG: TonB-dependent receptor [Pseudomonadota bacterium]
MIKHLLMTTALSTSILVLATTSGEAQNKQLIDVPAQPLGNAIEELSVEAGLLVVVKEGLVAGKTSRAVKGELTTQQALKTMVAGSGLSIIELPDRTFTLTEAASSQDGDVLLDEVVIVEGERSGRTLEEAPASIAVISGEDADKPETLNLRDVLIQVPNVLSEDVTAPPAIRGIDGSGFFGGPAFTSGTQARITTFVDGVPRPASIGGGTTTFQSNWDTEQVEVGRGPQSTLGGRNSLGGAIRVKTKDPVHALEGAARGYYFNQDGTIGGAATFNAPIVPDQVAVRFTAEGSDGERFVDVLDPLFEPFEDEINDTEDSRFRGKILIEPAALPNLRIVGTAERINSFGPFGNFVDEDGATDTITDIANFTSNLDNEQTVYSVQANYEFTNQIEAEIRLSRITNDLALVPFFEPVTATQIFFPVSQDLDSNIAEGLLRFQDIGRLNRGVIGFTFENQDEEVLGSDLFPLIAEGDIRSLGVFGEVDIEILKRLDLILGGRVEDDNRERFLATFGGVPGSSLPFGGSASIDLDTLTFIPKIGVRFQATDNITVGYQYTEGFRPGGLDFSFFDPAATSTIFDSERLRQHEAYKRGTFFDGRATLNASIFYYVFDDAQVEGVGPSGLIGNLPEAQGIGGEIEGSYSFDNGFSVSVGLGFLDTEITDAGSATQFEGSELPRAPKVTANFGLGYAVENWDASLRVRHVGGQTTALGEDETDSYTTLDLAGGYNYEHGSGVSFRLEGFINNVTGELIDLGNGINDLPVISIGRPRTFGIAGTIKF